MKLGYLIVENLLNHTVFFSGNASYEGSEIGDGEESTLSRSCYFGVV